MRGVSQWGVIAVAAMCMVGISATVFAVPPVAVPEVSPASVPSVIALLSGSLLVVRASRGRR